MRCLSTMNIIEILRLRDIDLTTRNIVKAIGCSKTTVCEILSRCRECGLTYEEAVSLPSERVNELIYPDSFGRKQKKEEPDWVAIHNRMSSSRRINLQYIWQEEYRPEHPDGYSYSRFCAKYNEWKKTSGLETVMPQDREPGKELFIDWMGDTLDWNLPQISVCAKYQVVLSYNTFAFSNLVLHRPYITRFIVLILLFVPSVRPLL